MPASKKNPRVSNGHRRRQLRARVLREEDVCWLCNGTVDKTLPAGHPMAPEVDEIIPVSKGGSPYDRDNCRLTHRICNARRGNGSRLRAIVAPFTTARSW